MANYKDIMTLRKGFLVLPLFFAFAIAVLAAQPTSASAWSSYNNHDYGTLSVQVQVQNDFCGNSDNNNYYRNYPAYIHCGSNDWNGTYDRVPSDFTVAVNGAYPSQNYFDGSANTNVDMMAGAYSVSITNLSGYQASYSAGCSGFMDPKDTPTCTVTLRPPYYYGGGYNYNYNNYYPTYNTQPSYTYPTYTYTAPAPVTYTQSYVPTLPNTGFEPISGGALAFAIVLLTAAGIFLFPYVRKTATFIVG